MLIHYSDNQFNDHTSNPYKKYLILEMFNNLVKTNYRKEWSIRTIKKDENIIKTTFTHHKKLILK